MFHKFEGWAKAPEGTTHFCIQNCGSPWLKVDVEGFLWYYNGRRWNPYHSKAAHHRHTEGAIVRPKKRAKAKAVAAYKPLNVGEELTVENLRTTHAYAQIKRFVANNKATPYQQGQLVRLFLEEYNNCQKGVEAVHWRYQFSEERSVVNAFNWEKSKHGFQFWSAVHNGRQVVNLGELLGGKPPAKQKVAPRAEIVLEPAQPVPKPVEEVKQEEPKPKVGKVGWW